MSTSTLTRASKLFLDFETTGLDETRDAIAEVGVAAVSSDLRILDTYQTAFLLTPEQLAAIEATPIVYDMFEANGLLAELRYGAEMGTLPTLAEVEQDLLAFIDEYAESGMKVTLAGSGVATFDFRWIRELMPELAKRLTYWTADIGVTRRQWKESTGGDLVTVNDEKPHRGMDDVLLHLSETHAFDTVFRRLAQAAGGSDYGAVMSFLDRAIGSTH